MEFVIVIQNQVKTKIVFLLMLAFIFSSFQEVDAQRRSRKTAAKAEPKAEKIVPPEIGYTVSMTKPETHLLEVQMTMSWEQMPEKAEIKMPVWTPGSYLVREYARHVQDFVAVDASGNPLSWQKINKNTWEIDTKGSKGIRIGYRVYANELTVRTNELNDEHAFFTPAALLMFPKGQLAAPSTVKVNPYGNWKVATGLPAVAGQPNTFRAPNYDILYDSPFEVSDFHEKTFVVHGIPHRFVITGEGNYDLDRIAEDTAKIVDQAYQIFGELDYKDYTFLLNLRGGGGLEHLNSTALQWNKFGFAPENRYTAFLGLVAHEYFHNFNVKRLRPVPLGPFDYENENYTKLLWVAEGLTSYYEGIILRRAGIVKADHVLRNEAGVIEGLAARPGRFQTSLEEASFDAWIKYYRQDENSINNQISYYDKGDLVNFLLDIKIRAASNGTKSMDYVLRYLYEEFFKKGKNYSPEDFQKVCEMMAGTSLDQFFDRYVRGRDEIDYNSILNEMGLQLITRNRESDKGYLGAGLTESDGRLTIRSLRADSPAYESGLNTGDQIVAVNGFRASNAMLNFLVGGMKAGDKLKLSIFRRDELRDIEITLGKTPPSGYMIVPVSNPTAEQQALYQGLFGESLVGAR
ncbi:MAG: M61 family metallopeptidase [Acidobacteria bacterium]|nr:M61 family metallopeptidase [Acidobacteriota bacterium]